MCVGGNPRYSCPGPGHPSAMSQLKVMHFKNGTEQIEKVVKSAEKAKRQMKGREKRGEKLPISACGVMCSRAMYCVSQTTTPKLSCNILQKACV